MNIDENVQKNECSCNTENGKKMMEMLETERKRIVSELHDTSLQNIAHLVHMINWLPYILIRILPEQRWN